MYAEKAKTCFAGYQCEWSMPLCAVHIADALQREDQYVAVCRKPSITAACGAAIVYTTVPPYGKIVIEWMWWGDNKKDTVSVWHECEQWGKAQGAKLSECGLNRRQVNKTKWIENHKWRVL
jgi:hypothetical protein